MKKLVSRFVVTLLVILVSFCSVVTATGCAAVIPMIPKIASVITDAIAILQIIDGAVQEFFRTHPDAPPELRARYTALHAKSLAALNAANHSLEGVEDLDQNQVDAAFAEFRAAYLELRDFLASEGLMVGGVVKAGDGTEIQIPEPEALTVRIDG